MAKKRPFIAMLYIVLIFALIAFISTMSNGITGFFIYENLTAAFSKNALVTIGPTAVFIILFSVAIITLHRMSKE